MVIAKCQLSIADWTVTYLAVDPKLNLVNSQSAEANSKR
jgi:hypothetical protein